MDYFTAEFLRTDVTEENPMVWLIEVDGVAVDSRSLPLEYQVVAFQRGDIPYIPISEFLRTDVTEENPMVWLIEVDGVAVDSRSLPLEYQVVAFQRGYIPYIPALGPEGTAAVLDEAFLQQGSVGSRLRCRGRRRAGCGR